MAQRAKADLILINNAISIIYLTSHLARHLTNLFWSLFPYWPSCLLFLLCSKIHNLYCKMFLVEKDRGSFTIANSEGPRSTSQFWDLNYLSKGSYLLPRTSSFLCKTWTHEQRESSTMFQKASCQDGNRAKSTPWTVSDHSTSTALTSPNLWRLQSFQGS